jgi:hypothetical protein
MTQLSESLDKFWDKQVGNGIVVAKPYSGHCMFCEKEITEQDDDHSVCNACWTNIGEEE